MDDLPPARPRSRRGLGGAAAVLLIVLGVTFGLVFTVGRSGRAVPVRPFTLDEKRALVAQLEGALAERRNGNHRAMVVHLSRARDLAKTHGQDQLAAQLVVHGSCGLGAVDWQLTRALELAQG